MQLTDIRYDYRDTSIKMSRKSFRDCSIDAVGDLHRIELECDRMAKNGFN